MSGTIISILRPTSSTFTSAGSGSGSTRDSPIRCCRPCAAPAMSCAGGSDGDAALAPPAPAHQRVPTGGALPGALRDIRAVAAGVHLLLHRRPHRAPDL